MIEAAEERIDPMPEFNVFKDATFKGAPSSASQLSWHAMVINLSFNGNS
jgi:hypothetical protein